MPTVYIRGNILLSARVRHTGEVPAFIGLFLSVLFPGHYRRCPGLDAGRSFRRTGTRTFWYLCLYAILPVHGRRQV